MTFAHAPQNQRRLQKCKCVFPTRLIIVNKGRTFCALDIRKDTEIYEWGFEVQTSGGGELNPVSPHNEPCTSIEMAYLCGTNAIRDRAINILQVTCSSSGKKEAQLILDKVEEFRQKLKLGEKPMAATATPAKKKRATPIKSTEEPVTAPERRSEAADGVDMKVPLTALVFDDKGDRLEELLDKTRIAELGRSMSSAGQLHPIQVTTLGAGEGKYRVVFGHRRVEAAKRLGWSEIRATVVNYTAEAQVLEAREIENIQRQELNPVEEAMAVANLVQNRESEYALREGMTAPREEWSQTLLRVVGAEAVKHVAERLAKSEQWVRDRMFLSRLSGGSRSLVVKGLLPLAHAREISKLADPNLRDRLAEEFAADEGDKRYGRTQPADLEDVRSEVSKHLHSLGQVPWKLEVAFAGCPACVDCPSNSANSPGLFEHASRFQTDPKSRGVVVIDNAKEPASGVCTNVECFKKKAAAANAGIRGATSKTLRAIKELPKKKRPAITPAFVADHSAAHLKLAVVAEQVKASLDAKPQKAKLQRERSPVTHQWDSPEHKGKQAWERACHDRAKQIEPLIAAAAAKKPGLWAILKLITLSKPFEATQNYDNKKAAKAMQSSVLTAMLKRLGEPGWDAIVAVEKECGRMFGIFDHHRDGRTGVVDLIAEQLGVDLASAGPLPLLTEFIEKEKGKKA